MGINKTGIPSLSYVGVTASTPPQLERHDRAPTPNDYYNFVIGTLWLDYSSMSQNPPIAPANEDIYMLVAKRGLVATWLPLGSSVSATLTGDTGGAITVDGNNNINVPGIASRITTTGNPVTNTVTWDIGSTVADTYETNSGDATPIANVLQIVGDVTGVTTSALANEVTITLGGTSYAAQYTTDSGTAIPSGGNLNVVGPPPVGLETTIVTSGVGDTLTISLGNTVATTFSDNGGNTATPSLNNINIVGGLGINTVASGNTITINSTGVGGLSSFYASITASIPGVVGNNPAYDVPFDTTFYDLNSDFNTGTGKFTAPKNGIYLFTATVDFDNLISSMTSCSIKLIVNDGSPTDQELRAFKINPFPIIDISSGTDEMDITIFGYLQLAQNDTVKVTVSLDGAPGNTANINQSGGTDVRTWFQGSLIALL